MHIEQLCLNWLILSRLVLSINYGDATDTLKSILNKEREKNLVMSICNESKPFCSKIDLNF